MIGIIVAGHGGFASELVSTAENILGKQECFVAVCTRPGEGDELLMTKLHRAVNEMQVQEIIVLADIQGGSIANGCMYFAKGNRNVRIITGVNLPMVLKALTYRNKLALLDLSSRVCEGGREGIKDICALVEN